MIANILTQGGMLMYPLLLCSLFSMIIIIERGVYWFKNSHRKDSKHLSHLLHHVKGGDYKTAIKLSDTDETKKLDITTRALIDGFSNREDDLHEQLELAALSEVDSMTRGMDILDTIITVAPLLGILGTVVGIITSFDAIGAEGIADPRVIGGGIAQALITTAAGLSVAIMTLIPYNFFVNKIKKTTNDINIYIIRIEVAYRASKRNKADL